MFIISKMGKGKSGSFVHDSLVFTRCVNKKFTSSPLLLHIGLTIGLRWCVVGANINESALWRKRIQSCAWIGFIHGLDWIGSEALKIIFEQLNCFSVLLSKSRLELLLTYL